MSDASKLFARLRSPEFYASYVKTAWAEEIRNALAVYMHEHNFSMTEVAGLTGIAEDDLRRKFDSEDPSLEEVTRICQALGATPRIRLERTLIGEKNARAGDTRMKNSNTPKPAELATFTGTEVFDTTGADRAFPTNKPWFTPADSPLLKPFYDDRNPTVKFLQAGWFKTNGRDLNSLALLPREDTNPGGEHNDRVWSMLCVVLGTWGIKHEHKMALASFIVTSFWRAGWYRGEEPREEGFGP